MSILYNFLRKKAIDELTEQGHNMTGRLFNSFKQVTNKTLDGYKMSIFIETYGLTQNAQYQIKRLGDLKRKRTRTSTKNGYVTGMLRFGRERGIPEKGIWAMIRSGRGKHPMKGAIKYSNNGRRTKWIENSIGRAGREFNLGNSFIEINANYENGAELFSAVKQSFNDAMKTWFEG